MPVMNPAASVASGLRALTCLSLLRFRKRKKPNYFDDYSGFADLQALTVRGGVITTCRLRDEKCTCKEIFCSFYFEEIFR